MTETITYDPLARYETFTHDKLSQDDLKEMEADVLKVNQEFHRFAKLRAEEKGEADDEVLFLMLLDTCDALSTMFMLLKRGKKYREHAYICYMRARELSSAASRRLAGHFGVPASSVWSMACRILARIDNTLFNANARFGEKMSEVIPEVLTPLRGY